MIIANEARSPTPKKRLRVTERLNSRVPVAVEWEDGTNTLRAEGHTVDVSSKGCMAIVPNALVVGQRLRLTNLANQHTSEAVLIWRGHESRSGWELGVELQNPPDDFWGLGF